MSQRILIIEDDANIRQGVSTLLKSNGYETTEACDGEDGLQAFQKQTPDLILLDIMMPKKNGYDVCREIRAAGSTVPIIMLTAKEEELDKVLGLEIGADDYVVKPFGVHELLARIQAVLRRSAMTTGNPAEETFDFGQDRVDVASYEIHHPDGTSVKVTLRECSLLKTFARARGKILSRNDLLNAVWGISYFGTTRTLDQHIANLRKKLTNPLEIETIHGIGYRFRG